MSDHPQSTWTNEQEAELTRLWNDGYSAGMIGPMIKRSRNSVISKALRLDLRSRPTVFQRQRSDRAPDQPRKPMALLPNGTGQPKAAAIAHRLATRPQAPTPPSEPFDMEDGEPVDVTALVGIMQNRGCKWISGDPLGQHGYCGKPFKAGSAAWCDEHHARVFMGSAR